MTVAGGLYAAFEAAFPEDRSSTLLTDASGRLYSYSYAAARSAQYANLLNELGLCKGDRVTVQAEKSPELFWLYLATIRAGFVFHPLNTAYTSDELAFFIEDAEPALAVCDPRNAPAIAGMPAKEGRKPTILTLAPDGTGSLPERAAGCDEDCPPCDVSTDDLAALIYSSGTTGRPKGIMLTHANLVHNTHALVDAWGFTGDDVLLHALPVFHVHGLFVAIGCVMMTGGSMRWLPGFDVEAVLASIGECTVMMGVPTYYTRLLADPRFDSQVCQNVRLFVSGSAPLLAETFAAFEARTGKAILERYGMTETGMNTSNPLRGERRAGTVGLPLPGVDVRVTGSDHSPRPTGEIGGIEVKGPNVFRGYWNLPDKTDEDFTEDGYFVTGDEGRFDEDGYLSIVGRSKDMIISGGLNVYPKEVELLIDEIPGVFESAVIGVPHEDFGEAVVAVVVPDQTGTVSPDAVVDHVRAHAANFKVPKRVFVADALPRNAMGKVQKNRLRGRYREAFGND